MSPRQRRMPADPQVDEAYSEWHRASSLSRFVEDADRVKMVDVDAVEVRGDLNRIAAIIETTSEPIERKLSKCSVSKRIARALKVPFYIVRIVLADAVNECSSVGALDVAEFEVCHVTTGRRTTMEPDQYARFLADMEAPVVA